MTLRELQTVYGLRDLYDLLEVGEVEAHNARVAARIAARARRGES